MKEALVYEDSRTEVVESPIPTPGAHQLVIKVAVSGTNPKDWKTWWVPKDNLPINMGDDFAGTVHEVGAAVTHFKFNDRVFAFHEIQKPGGSYAEYAVAWDYTTAVLPTNTSFEEASTIPLATLTASLGLYRHLCIPYPWSPATSVMPILIYGGSSAVGAFAIKLAKLSNLHPIIAVAGHGGDYVRSLVDISKGDTVIDYRQGPEAVKAGVYSALSGTQGLEYALDAISENGTSNLCLAVLQSGGTLAHVLPLEEGVEITDAKRAKLITVGDVHGAFGEDRYARDFAKNMMEYLSNSLANGTFAGHPYEVVPGGLGALKQILSDLRAGRASAKKYIFRPVETDGF